MKSPKKITLFEQQNDLNNLISEFIVDCKAHNLAQRTVNYYSYTFNRFIDTMNITSLEEINTKTINNYILKLRENANIHSVNSNLRAIRRVLYYFMDQNYMPQFKITLMKEPQPIKDTYSNDELKRLLKKPNLKESTFIEYRNWVIINFLIGTGCRLNTLINVKICDLDFENGFVKFNTTKNKHGLLVPLSSTLTKVLKEYLKYRQYENENDYLFPNSYGDMIHIRTLQQSISSYNKKRGVQKTSIHMFRHTFAKMWILNNGDMFKLQKILGHRDLTMVRRYVNMFSEDLKLNFDTFNPLENVVTKTSKIKLK